jgi:hypothetical protein
MSGARLVVDSYGTSPKQQYDFVAWSSPQGWNPYVQQKNIEELSARGLDGVRYRIVNETYPVFTAVGYINAASYTKAVRLSAQMSLAQGLTGSLDVTAGGYSLDVAIISVTAEAHAGPMAGESGDAHVRATMTLQRLSEA